MFCGVVFEYCEGLPLLGGVVTYVCCWWSGVVFCNNLQFDWLAAKEMLGGLGGILRRGEIGGDGDCHLALEEREVADCCIKA